MQIIMMVQGATQHFLDGSLVTLFVGDNTAAVEERWPRLELRLDEEDHPAVGFQKRIHIGDDVGQRDERHIRHDKVELLMMHLFRGEFPEIPVLDGGHSRVVTQRLHQLLGAHIHGGHVGGPVLQSTVREATG